MYDYYLAAVAKLRVQYPHHSGLLEELYGWADVVRIGEQIMNQVDNRGYEYTLYENTSIGHGEGVKLTIVALGAGIGSRKDVVWRTTAIHKGDLISMHYQDKEGRKTFIKDPQAKEEGGWHPLVTNPVVTMAIGRSGTVDAALEFANAMGPDSHVVFVELANEVKADIVKNKNSMIPPELLFEAVPGLQDVLAAGLQKLVLDLSRRVGSDITYFGCVPMDPTGAFSDGYYDQHELVTLRMGVSRSNAGFDIGYMRCKHFGYWHTVFLNVDSMKAIPKKEKGDTRTGSKKRAHWAELLRRLARGKRRAL